MVVRHQNKFQPSGPKQCILYGIYRLSLVELILLIQQIIKILLQLIDTTTAQYFFQ